MKDWKWNGSRWWKFDFHTHTPASDDYGRGPNQVTLKAKTPREWLLDHMSAGIDCIAITDHNTGAWIDRLKTALSELEAEQPVGFRPIYLFPGMEITVQGSIHLLAIFDQSKNSADMDALRGAVEFDGTPGHSDGATRKSFVDVVRAVVEAGGIALPAHADESNGVFMQRGTTLRQHLNYPHLFAVEMVNPAYVKPQLYVDLKCSWTEVFGSDSHHPSGSAGERYPGSHFTWIKMGPPSLEGLRLALLDGPPLSVLRSDAVTSDPNEHAGMVIEAVEITQARYMGRPSPFSINLNPWLNAVIGGRGTGKSTLVEFLRLGMQRENELPKELREEFGKYGQTYANREDSGLLTNNAAIQIVYRKNGARFRIQWKPDGSADPIQEDDAGVWRRTEGDLRQRFPVRMYSQKQIFHLAKTPLALLRIIDEAPEVGYVSWRERWKAEEGRFLSLRAKARELETTFSEESRLLGELDDVKRKLAVFEQSGHADILKSYQKRKRQQQAIEAWEASWSKLGEHLREIAAGVLPKDLDESSFDVGSDEDNQLLGQIAQLRAELSGIGDVLTGLAENADKKLEQWQSTRDASAWRSAVQKAVSDYQGLQETLSSEGAGDPASYGALVQRRQTIEKQIKAISDLKNQVKDLRDQANASLGNLLQLRREITNTRRSFLENVLKDNHYVHIEVVPYGSKETAESEFRSLVQREDRGFEKDIGTPDGDGFLGNLYRRGFENVESSIAEIKSQMRMIANGHPQAPSAADKRFAAHLAKLPPEFLDRLDLWFPEDSLDVKYRISGDSETFRPIHEGSPGQKTAALLAFLLSYGEEPLILDQPEDDLDNHLIYELIVTQLREVKRRRQIVVVTHNANIVVNGDAELVVALAARNGQTQVEALGSLQEKDVRDTICTVMEGGLKAFEQRYRRIALEGRQLYTASLDEVNAD